MADETRLGQITERILSDLRSTVTDFRITEDEIHAAADFLNDMGRAGEFPDLLDIFLAVTSVVATAGPSGGTTPNLSGPYYKAGAPTRGDGKLYDGGIPNGETPLVVRGTVSDVATGEPIAGALLDVWQADGAGEYDEEGYHLRGVVPVEPDGSYEFRTVLPEGYQIPAKGPTTQLLEMIGQHNWRPAHIHIRVHVGDTTPLQTQFFVAGARYLDSDPVDAVRDDLIVEPRDADDGLGKVMEFPIRIALDGAGAPRRSTADGPKAAVAGS